MTRILAGLVVLGLVAWPILTIVYVMDPRRPRRPKHP
jgi:hypothetical protein